MSGLKGMCEIYPEDRDLYVTWLQRKASDKIHRNAVWQVLRFMNCVGNCREQ